MMAEVRGYLPAITGVGLALPRLEEMETDLGHRARLAFEVRTHHHDEGGPYAVDLALRAGQMALQHSQLDGSDITLLLVGSVTQPDVPDYLGQISAALGVPYEQTQPYDFNEYGGLAGLQLADEILRSYASTNRTDYKAAKILVLGIDTPSTLPDIPHVPDARLFSDGAGAAVLQPQQDTHPARFVVLNGVSESRLILLNARTDTDDRDAYRDAANIMHLLYEQNEHGLPMSALHMAGLLVAKIAHANKAGTPSESIDWEQLSYHISVQINRRVLDLVGLALEVSEQQNVDTSKYFSHTLLASNLMAIALLSQTQHDTFGITAPERFLSTSVGTSNHSAATIMSAKFPNNTD